jgi:microcystin-dependent protein
MSNLFLGQIVMFGGNFAPRGTAFCDGQILPISQNTALFSLLGTQYGGNGTSNFALPNLQGSVPVHQGAGPGLSEYVMGQSGGSQTVGLLISEIPVHSHTFNATTANATSSSIANNLLPATPTATNAFAYAVSQPSYPALAPTALGGLLPQGGSQPHANMMPTLFISFLITLQGVFPSRS